MAIPRVFVSSTCYDLSEIRHGVEAFIRGFGCIPILSDRGDVFFHPELHTHESCIKEVQNCQIFILIVGGRFGGGYICDPKISVTNAEYAAAKLAKVPVFAFVKKDVWQDHFFFQKNKEKREILKDLTFPSIEKTEHAFQIFSFIDEVRLSPYNNALLPFDTSSDLYELLRKQWAGLLFDFLQKSHENQNVQESLKLLSDVNRRVEALSEQILRSVGSDYAKLTAKLYDVIFSWECIRDLAWFGLKPTPYAVLKASDYSSLAKLLGLDLQIDESRNEEYALIGGGIVSKKRYELNVANFQKTQSALVDILKENKLTPQDYLKKCEEGN
jgi:hypothetical protein